MSNKNYEKITVVIPSEKTYEEKEEFINHVKATAGVPVDLVFVGNNKTSLTTVYQNNLDSSDNEIIVFIHDDIEFLKNGWGKEIIDIFSKNPQFGIIGVAGSREYGIDNEMAWWKYSDKRGLIFHGDEKYSWLTFCSDYNFKSKVSEVVVIDGVFMAINREKIEYNFDEDIPGFHFYDIDFCLANFLSRRCKVGVTDRVCIRHRSIGKTNDAWLKNGKLVFEKYKDNFPLKTFGK